MVRLAAPAVVAMGTSAQPAWPVGRAAWVETERVAAELEAFAEVRPRVDWGAQAAVAARRWRLGLRTTWPVQRLRVQARLRRKPVCPMRPPQPIEMARPTAPSRSGQAWSAAQARPASRCRPRSARP